MIFGHDEINSHNWKRTIAAPWSQAEHAWFQAQLDSLVGVESDGTKRLRLVWMPSFERWDAYAQQWIPFRCVKNAVEVAPTGGLIVGAKFDYIGIPRYAIVGLVPEESRPPEAERQREGFDRDGTHFAADRSEREWVLVLPIVEHNSTLLPVSNANKCCAEMSRQYGKKCWGRYRHPDGADLQWLQSQLATLSPLLGSKPYERSSNEDKWRLAKHLLGLRQQQIAREDKEVDQIIQTEFLNGFANRTYSLPN
jgi:hypothetical protein